MSFLKKIVRSKKEEIQERMAQFPPQELQQHLAGESLMPVRELGRALSRSANLSVIAEIKGVSPSLGVLKENFDPLTLAGDYEKNGAGAISVLTDEKFFGGHLDRLKAVRQAVQIPCLRKDFIIDSYQIDESRWAGADAFLLIARILSRDQLHEFLDKGRRLGMEALVEVHDEEDLEKVHDLPVSILGFNNRNLDDLSIDLNRSLHLKKKVSGNFILVSESGISTAEDLKKIQRAGFDAVLIGSALMLRDNPGQRLGELLGENI